MAQIMVQTLKFQAANTQPQYYYYHCSTRTNIAYAQCVAHLRLLRKVQVVRPPNAVLMDKQLAWFQHVRSDDVAPTQLR